MLIDTCNFCLNGVFGSLSLEHGGCFSSRNVLLLSDTFRNDNQLTKCYQIV